MLHFHHNPKAKPRTSIMITSDQKQRVYIWVKKKKTNNHNPRSKILNLLNFLQVQELGNLKQVKQWWGETDWLRSCRIWSNHQKTMSRFYLIMVYITGRRRWTQLTDSRRSYVRLVLVDSDFSCFYVFKWSKYGVQVGICKVSFKIEIRFSCLLHCVFLHGFLKIQVEASYIEVFFSSKITTLPEQRHPLQ